MFPPQAAEHFDLHSLHEELPPSGGLVTGSGSAVVAGFSGSAVGGSAVGGSAGDAGAGFGVVAGRLAVHSPSQRSCIMALLLQKLASAHWLQKLSVAPCSSFPGLALQLTSSL
jgi:hypothetical protein